MILLPIFTVLLTGAFVAIADPVKLAFLSARIFDVADRRFELLAYAAILILAAPADK